MTMEALSMPIDPESIQWDEPQSNTIQWDDQPVESAEPLPSTGERFLIGAGSGLINVAEGAEQLARESAIERTKAANIYGGEDANFGLGTLSQFIERIMSASPEEQQTALDEFNDEVTARRKQFEESPVGQTFAGKAGEFVGEAAPYAAVPGGASGNLIKRMATGAIAGSGIGASQFVEEGQERSDNAKVGAAFGAAAPAVISAGKKVVGEAADLAKQKIAPLFGRQTDDLVRELSGDVLEPQSAKAVKASGRLGDEFITPAEASGRGIQASAQGRLGASSEGSKILEDRFRERASKQSQIIKDYMDSLSDSGSAAQKVQNAARSVIDDIDRVRIKAAKPFYDAAKKQLIPEDQVGPLLENSIIHDAFEKVAKDKVWQSKLKDVPTNSIEYIDIVKRAIDDEIEMLTRAGERAKAGIVRDAKSQLVGVADDVSTEYKTARKLYELGSKLKDDIDNKLIGKISNLPPLQLKNLSKIVFDPNETTPAVRIQLKKLLEKKDPGAWRQLLRNEFERRIDQVKDVRGPGQTFYDVALARPKDFKMFLDATKGIPGARKKLVDMRRAWRNLTSRPTVKTAAGQAATSMSEGRSTWERILRVLESTAGAKRDKISAELITNNTWDKDLAKIGAAKTDKEVMERVSALISKVGASVSEDVNAQQQEEHQQ